MCCHRLFEYRFPSFEVVAANSYHEEKRQICEEEIEPKNDIFLVLKSWERESSVATWLIELMRYTSILSVHGERYHFLKVGKNATISITPVRITVLRVFLEMIQ
jgi:hypothetical protein